jgi:hypothetical protein
MIRLFVGSDPFYGVRFSRKPKHRLMNSVHAEDFDDKAPFICIRHDRVCCHSSIITQPANARLWILERDCLKLTRATER